MFSWYVSKQLPCKHGVEATLAQRCFKKGLKRDLKGILLQNRFKNQEAVKESFSLKKTVLKLCKY